jgi:tetratricopeptide (TPR) repeat protein
MNNFRQLVSHSRMRIRLLLPLALCLAAPLWAEQSLADQARALYAAKQYPEARAVLEKLAAAEPQNAEARFYLGDLAQKRGDTDEQVNQLEQAVALAPNNATYLVALGGAYGEAAQKAGIFSKLGFAKKCLASFQKAVEIEPKNVDAHQALWSFYRAAPSFAGGGHDKAVVEAEEIRKLDPVAGATALGQLYVDDKKVDEAFALFVETLKTAPDNYGLLYGVGRTAAQSGTHLEQGEAALRKCLKLMPPQGQPPIEAVHWRLGNIAEKRGDKPAAKAEYEAAVAANPNFKPAVDALAKVRGS